MTDPTPLPRGSRLREMLMQAILTSCIVLGGLIVWRLVGPFWEREKDPVVVKEAVEEAYDRADQARREIQNVEKKAWARAAPVDLAVEDRTAIAKQLAELEESDRRFEKLILLLRKQNLEDCGEMRQLTPCRLRTKVWILDARAVLAPPNDPSSPPGFFIPFHRTLARWQDARRELTEVRALADGLPAGEKRALQTRIRAIRESLVECRDELLRLEEFVRAGLRLESLSTQDLPDVETLRENTSLIQQAMLSAGQLDLLLRE